MALPYLPGAQQATVTDAFIDAYSALREERMSELVQAWGNQRFTDLVDLFGESIPTVNVQYQHYERDRWHQKIKATTAGGAANAAVTFTLNAASINEIQYTTPPPSSAATVKAFPVKPNDILRIKPASGVWAGSLIQAIVISVNTGANTFVARSMGATAIPAVTDDEIIVTHTAVGDGGPLPRPMAFTTSDYLNSVSQGGFRTRITDNGRDSRTWYKDASGNDFYWTPKMYSDLLDFTLNQRELMLLTGQALNNVDTQNIYTTAETPLIAGNGLIPEMIARGNDFSYSAITGPTFNWFRTVADIIDKQKGATLNWFFMGQKLRSDINKMGLNELQGGTITLGNFVADQEKYISLSFKQIEVDGKYFNLKTLPTFNDLQTLGAQGYTFPKEGMIIPDSKVSDPKTGAMTNCVRMRHMTNEDGSNSSMRTTFYDGLTSAADGNGIKELRATFKCGLELVAANMTGYVHEA
jgi:hypothetical protein